MFTLGELVEILRKSLEVYFDIAEDNGKCGDIPIYQEMMREYELVSDFCIKLENDYIQHQTIHRIQLNNLLSGEDEKVYKAVHNIIKVYNENLKLKIEKIKEEQEKLESIRDVIVSIEA